MHDAPRLDFLFFVFDPGDGIAEFVTHRDFGENTAPVQIIGVVEAGMIGVDAAAPGQKHASRTKVQVAAGINVSIFSRARGE